MRIPVAQATQLRRLNVGTIRQLQCIHLLAFAPKQKINTNRRYLFPVGRKSSLCVPFFPVSISCAIVSVINRQFDALFQTKILLDSFKCCSAAWLKELIDRLSFDDCSNYECTRGFGERKYKSCYILTLFFYSTTVDTRGRGATKQKGWGCSSCLVEVTITVLVLLRLSASKCPQQELSRYLLGYRD